MPHDPDKALEAYGSHVLFAEELNTNEGKVYTIEGIDTSRSVRDLRNQISRTIGDKTSWNSMRLIYGGEALADLTKSLYHYGVRNGDTVYFIRSIPDTAPPPYAPAAPEYPGESFPAQAETVVLSTLFFKDVDGKTYVLSDVDIETLVGDVIARLAREKSLEADWRSFKWSGKVLKPERTVRDYGIMNESTIHITGRLHGGWT
ncbi:viral ubiquitin [Ophiostoma piceae UAMH 11346]|uniref:Viral ubiquitin n=1 Tax=Ophiostoma piceae (strain UAMH 11346) TaxID=1262450 RepID=S3CST2_OPHP1|nr:viral ubiquitin [Ophiostoma piceae UAMH 11346]